MDSRVARLWLASAAQSAHPFPTAALFKAFGTPEGIFSRVERETEKVGGLSGAARRSLLFHPVPAQVSKHLERLDRDKIRLVSYDEPEYPDRLRSISDPPPVLFVKGTLLPEDSRAVAVVGSRNATPYGIWACQFFAEGLARAGFCVVSGLAVGIDATAHWACLEAGGRTIGVLGTGLDRVYPKANARLFEQIPGHGALVSELPLETPPAAWNFPRRNRLISGLSAGVLVVEACERSGTSITVRTALEQGRDVFAVPGDIRSPGSRGPHRLIQEGAKLVESVDDIVAELEGICGSAGPRAAFQSEGPDRPKEERPAGRSVGDIEFAGLPDEETRALLGHIDDRGTTLETLERRTGWPLDRLSWLLTELELLGKVQRLPGSRYGRRG